MIKDLRKLNQSALTGHFNIHIAIFEFEIIPGYEGQLLLIQFIDNIAIRSYTIIMSRSARIVIPDIPHHITQRGNYRQQVFFSDEDRLVYLRVDTEITSHSLQVFSPPAFVAQRRNIPDMPSQALRGRRRKSSAKNVKLFPRRPLGCCGRWQNALG